MSRRIFAAPAIIAVSLLWTTSASGQGWGPPPPTAAPSQDNADPNTPTEPDVEPEAQPEPSPEPEAQPEPEPEPTPAPQANLNLTPQPEPEPEPDESAVAEVVDEEGTADDEGQGDEEEEEGSSGGGVVGRILSRIEFHGYARMPLNIHFRPAPEPTSTGGDETEEGAAIQVRSPFLIDNDYYLSGFAYTRLTETDWTELFLTARVTDNVSVTVGLFASLYSDWAYTSVDRQFGIAQASVTWEGVGGVEPLVLKAGVFWDRLGYIEPYDTYVFGRTHQMGLQLGWNFPNEGLVRVGFGAHLEVLQQNQGFTPIFYAYGGSPLGSLPITVSLYLVGLWSSDVRPLTTMEEGHLVVFGGDIQIDFPWFDGPLYIAAAYYWAERALFLANVFELLHSTGGRGLTENYFGIQDSENGTGEIFAGAVNWPITIWRGLGVHFFGMLAHVQSEQRSDNPLINRDDRTYLKWGLEPSYQFTDWFRLSLRYDRVILDMNHPGMAFRALTPTATFTAWEGIDVLVGYSHYFYGDDIQLRPNQIPGVTAPDEDVFRIMARAEW